MISGEKTTFSTDTPPYGLRKAIEALKNYVPIEQVATEYGEFKLAGPGRLLGRCLAPDHTDRTPSMTVFTDTQRFKCFGCGIGGDVIDLEEIGGRHADTWTTVVELSLRHNVELPQRPPAWFDWQDEKGKRHRAIRRALADSYQRRFFRAFFTEYLSEVEPEVREAEAAEIWGSLRAVAVHSANKRTSA